MMQNFSMFIVSVSSERVAEHTIQLIKSAANGSIWLSDNGQLSEVTMTAYSSPLAPEYLN